MKDYDLTKLPKHFDSGKAEEKWNRFWQENEIYLLSTKLFGALHPGGPNTFNRILIDKNPTWADFQQEDHGEMRAAGVIFHESSFGPELGMGVNPAVVLVVYGIKNDWHYLQMAIWFPQCTKSGIHYTRMSLSGLLEKLINRSTPQLLMVQLMLYSVTLKVI